MLKFVEGSPNVSRGRGPNTKYEQEGQLIQLSPQIEPVDGLCVAASGYEKFKLFKFALWNNQGCVRNGDPIFLKNVNSYTYFIDPFKSRV